jgi:hypothetical protein
LADGEISQSSTVNPKNPMMTATMPRKMRLPALGPAPGTPRRG